MTMPTPFDARIESLERALDAANAATDRATDVFINAQKTYDSVVADERRIKDTLMTARRQRLDHLAANGDCPGCCG